MSFGRLLLAALEVNSIGCRRSPPNLPAAKCP
jgi:hypothetical protein